MRKAAKLALALIAGSGAGAWCAPASWAQGAAHPAYVVVEMHVTDPAGFMNYARQLPATLAAYHGKILARGLPDIREGRQPDGDVMILAFDNLRDANRWYQSPEYSKLIEIRQRAATARVMIVDGLPQ